MSELPQHIQALNLAQAIRMRRAELHRNVRAGTMSPISAIRDPACRRAYVAEVLKWQHRTGTHTTERALRAVGIAPGRVCGDLTERQIKLLSEWLRASEAERQRIARREYQFWRQAA